MRPFVSSLTRIPTGIAGTRKTLEAMERLVRQGIRDPEVVLYAQQAVRGAPEYGQRAELDAILDDVRRTMRYTLDPVGVETVKSPSFILREIRDRGRAVMDCDDASVWTAALVRSVGMNTRWKVIQDDPTEFTHVFLEAEADGRWIPVDPIARTMRAGKAPRGQFGSAVWEDGAMHRTLGEEPKSILDYGGALAQGYVDYANARLQNKLKAPVAAQERFPAAAIAPPIQAPPFPWGKVLLVAGLGVGAIFALRMMRRGRR